MDTQVAHLKIDNIAAEISATLGSGRQIAPFSARAGGLTTAEAYRVAALVARTFKARGETLIGRKIGFTNRTIWPEYNVYAPIWGHVTDRTVHELATTPALPLAGFAEPRIEPEIVFGLSRAPAPDMDETALADCIDWVAHGFEIVQSLFPGWKFTAADTIACNALHGALLIGARQCVQAARCPMAARACRFRHCSRAQWRLGGPRQCRKRARQSLPGPAPSDRGAGGGSGQSPLAAGEIVSTGTLTRALPIAPGETWRTRLDGIALEGIALRFS